jgi:hypothetical protein
MSFATSLSETKIVSTKYSALICIRQQADRTNGTDCKSAPAVCGTMLLALSEVANFAEQCSLMPFLPI